MTAARAIVEPPSAGELLLLVADFLEQEIGPLQNDDKLRFRVKVAVNLLRIARREMDAMPDFALDDDGYAVPFELIASAVTLRALTTELRDGRRDLLEADTFALLRRQVERKLRIVAPGLLAGNGDSATRSITQD